MTKQRNRDYSDQTESQSQMPSLNNEQQDKPRSEASQKSTDTEGREIIKDDDQVVEIVGHSNEYRIQLKEDTKRRNASLILENEVTGEQTKIILRAEKNGISLGGALQFDDREFEISLNTIDGAVSIGDISLQNSEGIDLGFESSTERLVAFSGGGWNSHSTLAGIIAGALDTSGQSMESLFARTQAVSANSGGTWFLSHLAYNSSFLTSLESEASRDQYTKTGYNGMVRGAFSNLEPSKETKALRSIAEAFGTRVDSLLNRNDLNTILPYITGLAGNAIAVNKLNWRSFIDQFVYGYDRITNLQSVNLDSPRQAWAAGKDLSFATAITALPTVIHNQGRLSQNKLFTEATPSVKPEWWNRAERKPAVLPLLIVSDADGTKSQSGYVEFPFGDVELEFTSNEFALTRPDPITGIIPKIPKDKLSIIDITTASSSAAGLLASPNAYGTGVLSRPFRNTAASSLREMAPLATFASNEIRTPNETAFLADNTKLKDVGEHYLARLADGGYVDNTSVAYGLRQLQRSSGLTAPFEVTLLMNSSVDPITMLPMPISEGGIMSNYRVASDIAKLFGFDAKGNEVKAGVIDFDALPSQPSVPSPWIFKKEAWEGIEQPLWSFTADNGSYASSYFKLPVTTRDNEILGIRGGQKGIMHLFLTNNSQSFAAPVTPSILDEYDENYRFAREAMASGGWEHLAKALGINAA